jgi:hypothetical protein
MESTVPQSDNINELAKALASAQSQMKVAPFNKVNPHFKNKYADLTAVIDAVRGPLNDNCIAFTQMPENVGGAICLVTRFLHSSGQWMSGEYPLPANVSPQQLGSALTYAKRYSLAAMAGISSDEDDDAEGARKDNQVATLPKRDNPHVTQPRDVNDYQERIDPATGEVVDCIPVHGHRVQKLKVTDARPVAETLLHAMRACTSAPQLVTWAEEHAEQFASLPDKWIAMYQGEYQALLDNLRKQKAA